MDREILFRGKDIYGKWFYGDLINLTNELKQICNHTQFEHAHSVDIKTIGQYTGLNDKNGKKIFEGDIVSTENSDDYLGVVEWEKDNAGLAVSFDGLFEKFKEINFVDKVKLEVIGNIHDNPELIKQEG